METWTSVGCIYTGVQIVLFIHTKTLDAKRWHLIIIISFTNSQQIKTDHY
jgi:hypothetical protein